MSSTGSLRLEGVADPADSPPDHERSGCGDRLAEVLRSELRLLSDLQAALRIQRQGVAADDIEVVDRSLHTIHRLILILAEAREQRRLLLDQLGISGDVSLGALETELGAQLTEPARAVIQELRAKALTLAREVEGNRKILESALEENDAYARTLYDELSRGPVYDAGARRTTGKHQGGALLNQRV